MKKPPCIKLKVMLLIYASAALIVHTVLWKGMHHSGAYASLWRGVCECTQHLGADLIACEGSRKEKIN